MLNAKQERELVYLVTIDDIKPIPGKDRVECAVVGGWTVMVKKDQFKPGDIGIYFEIDSKVPETKPFEFLAAKHYKIKTQKYRNSDGSQFWSQGLLMHPNDFGWEIQIEPLGGVRTEVVVDSDKNGHYLDDDTRFLTKELNVVYSVKEDNRRKAKSLDKYKSMAQRNSKLFSHQPFSYLMKHTWGKKLLFVFFGRKTDKKKDWPAWVKKTDEERVQNMPWILENKDPWIATEKIDGSSTTFTIRRKPFGKYEFFVCSRNICFDNPEKEKGLYHDTNIYTEMAEKYNIEQKMKDMLYSDPYFKDCEWITIQGETYGEGVQKRDYGVKGHEFMAFNLITSKTGRINSKEMVIHLEEWFNIPCIPIIDTDYILPDTVEELLTYATGKSTLDGGMREGIVFRSQDGTQSFKAVSNEFILKYH